MSGDEREERVDRRNINKRFEGLDDQLAALAETILDHSVSLDQLQQDMPNDDPGRGANVPLCPFSGSRNEDFSQYLKQFELICDANNFKADKRAQILASYLRDKAFYVYDSLPAATKTDYDALKTALREKFQTTDQIRYLHQKFQERKQGYLENVMEYGCDLHRLGMAALSKVDPDQRDHLIREKFLSGLRPEYHKLIVYSNPKDFHDAMTLAERLEGLQPTEREENVKHTLLLEGIQKKLEKLEMSREYTPMKNDVPYPAYALTNPFPSRPNFRPSGVNLNNFRQTIGPRGNRCFRCNRSGHIARNCPQTFNPRSVICRLCNRPGHFARDCQRRLPSSRRPYAPNRSQTHRRDRIPAFYNRVAPQPQFAGPPFPSSVMPQQNQPIMTVREQEETTQEATWQPLVAGVVSQSTRALRAKKIKTSVDAQVQADAPGQPPLEPTTRPQPAPTSVETTGLSQRCRDGTNKQVQLPFLTTVCACRLIVTRLLILLLLFISYKHILSVGAYTIMKDDEDYSVSPHRLTSPMICQAQESRILWKLPETFSCPGGNHTAQDEVVPTAMKLFKRNFIQYKSDAWKCIKITEEMETYTYFFGDENLKKEKKYQEAVSAEECIAMKQFQRCHNQPMAYQGGIYQTNNKLNWYYPGGGINCCHWKKFKVSNCYLYRTSVYKKHSNPIMESGAGDVSKCLYTKGQCIMEDGAFLLWNVNNRSFCELLPWKTVPGKMFGTSWLSDDSNLALTFTQKRTTTDCQNLPLKLSDQGIPVRILPTPNPRQKRSVQYGGFVSSAQLAASLEALELKWKQNMNFLSHMPSTVYATS